MTTPVRRLGSFLDLVSSAINAAAATEAGRRPRRQDLERLGIDAENFGRVRLR